MPGEMPGIVKLWRILTQSIVWKQTLTKCIKTPLSLVRWHTYHSRLCLFSGLKIALVGNMRRRSTRRKAASMVADDSFSVEFWIVVLSINNQRIIVLWYSVMCKDTAAKCVTMGTEVWRGSSKTKGKHMEHSGEEFNHTGMSIKLVL